MYLPFSVPYAITPRLENGRYSCTSQGRTFYFSRQSRCDSAGSRPQMYDARRFETSSGAPFFTHDHVFFFGVVSLFGFAWCTSLYVRYCLCASLQDSSKTRDKAQYYCNLHLTRKAPTSKDALILTFWETFRLCLCDSHCLTGQVRVRLFLSTTLM
jgi:hypothetical protein